MAGDSRRTVGATDRHYPGNARRTRPWMWAVAGPVLLVLALAGILAYQQVFGTRSLDPLTLNAKARDAVILLPVPEGWTRTDVVLTCPGEPDGCAGGGFKKVGTTSTTWVSPTVPKGTTRADAAEAACQDLSAQLLARTGAPPLRVADCVPFLDEKPSAQRDDEAISSWADADGEWAVFAVPRSVLPDGTAAKQFGFEVDYQPKV